MEALLLIYNRHSRIFIRYFNARSFFQINRYRPRAAREVSFGGNVEVIRGRGKITLNQVEEKIILSHAYEYIAGSRRYVANRRPIFFYRPMFLQGDSFLSPKQIKIVGRQYGG